MGPRDTAEEAALHVARTPEAQAAAPQPPVASSRKRKVVSGGRASPIDPSDDEALEADTSLTQEQDADATPQQQLHEMARATAIDQPEEPSAARKREVWDSWVKTLRALQQRQGDAASAAASHVDTAAALRQEQEAEAAQQQQLHETAARAQEPQLEQQRRSKRQRTYDATTCRCSRCTQLVRP